MSDGSSEPPRKTRLYGLLNDATVADSQELTAVDEPAVGTLVGRYELEDVLGRGGMGEVLSARDAQIGRKVAIKRLRVVEPSDELVARFLREARIQGQLEHPAIVPVHELWHEPAGRPFFVMKQLAGVTLADVLPAIADGEPEATAKYTLQSLLRAFVDVCLALELAHTRGVVHRDLKPANIMVGDFGEVYVLDWGIARVTGGEDHERPSFADLDSGDTADTVAGAILGTPGYISPEQIRGDRDLDGRADVYALGCILFELLALSPLHPRSQAALATALAGVDARASVRSPERAIPPELDTICVRATALDRAARFPSARALGDAVQRFLDGNRDLALRKRLAAAELSAAQAAFAAGDDPTAMRAAARALALDPTDRGPADLVGALMLAPRDTTPPEVIGELEQLDLTAYKAGSRFSMVAAAVYFVFFPILYWVGFHDLWYLIVGPILSAGIFVSLLLLEAKHPTAMGYVSLVGNLMMFALFAWLTSPVVFGSGPAILVVSLLIAHRRLLSPWPLAVIAALVTTLPWIARLVRDGLPIATSGPDLIIHTSATQLAAVPTFVSLLFFLAGMILLATQLWISQDNATREVRRGLQIQSWRLRQLMPRVASGQFTTI